MGSLSTKDGENCPPPPYYTEEDSETSKYGIMEINIVSKDPMTLFKLWYEEAKGEPENTYPEAMTLATIRKDGGPSARTVLLRGLDEHGFKMYWDHRSRKTAEIDKDSRGALVFCWTYKDEAGIVGGRQARIEGILERLTEDDNTDYFNGEPLLAKLRATACHQSRVVTDNRDSLLAQVSTLWEGVTKNKIELTKPKYWGGYRLVPTMIEFYQGQRDTINDRIRFRRDTEEPTEGPGVHKGENGWIYERLEP